MKRAVFLDYNATTPMSDEAKRVMVDLAGQTLNPSSVHSFGRKGKSFLDKARKQIALLVGLENEMRNYNITFTASGTEANNLILANYANGEIFVSAIEHASIAMPAAMIPRTYVLPTDKRGIVRLDVLEEALAGSSDNKKLVSVMLANNETGIIQPLKEIVEIAHKYGAQVHSDIVQAVGKMPLDLVDIEVDFASISGHKFGGSPGCGALIARTAYHLQPILYGGGQEKSLRSGTENILAIAATGAAAEECARTLDKRIENLRKKRDYFEDELAKRLSSIEIISKNEQRLPNSSGLIVPGKSSSLMVIALDLRGFAIGSGSACSSGKVSRSKVLEAMGYDKQLISSALRVSFGIETTMEEIDSFITVFEEIVENEEQTL